jgi:proteasome accessory factor B
LRAVVRIDASHAGRLSSEVAEDDVVRRLEDGSVEVQVPCTNLAAFRSWLFGFGTHAEVIAPVDVRAAVVTWLRALAATR